MTGKMKNVTVFFRFAKGRRFFVDTFNVKAFCVFNKEIGELFEQNMR
jgi:hypothetical protein